MAGLPKGHRVWYVEKERTLQQKVMASLMKGRLRLARAAGLDVEEPVPAAVPPALRAVAGQLGETAKLLSFNDPHGAYAYCFCDVR
jgi:hypothetical protein